MPALNDKIVAYLTVNNIAFSGGDYMTGQPEGEPDQILVWNEGVLGSIPTDEQMDSAYVIYSNNQKKAANKAQAAQLLSESDWTAMASVSNPELSNPYLANQGEFLAYRSALRSIAVNPPVDPTWPTKPTEQWN